jgi:hypothetical protein
MRRKRKCLRIVKGLQMQLCKIVCAAYQALHSIAVKAAAPIGFAARDAKDGHDRRHLCSQRTQFFADAP